MRIVAMGLTALFIGYAPVFAEQADFDPIYHDSFLQKKGGMRTDVAPQDAPFTRQNLIAAFENVVFEFESDIQTDRNIFQYESYLRRWESDVYLLTLFSTIKNDPLLASKMPRVLEVVQDTVQEISDITGLHIAILDLNSLDLEKVNVIMALVDPSEWQDMAGLEREAGHPLGPMLGDMIIRHFSTRGRGTVTCPSTVHFTGLPGEENAIIWGATAFGLDLTEKHLAMCVVEELVNMIGPQGDYQHARPSILNDDNEFINITEMDRLILKIMYDGRLRAGMSRDEVMPIVTRIVRGLPDVHFVHEDGCEMPDRIIFRPELGRHYIYATTGNRVYIRQYETYEKTDNSGYLMERWLMSDFAKAKKLDALLPPLRIHKLDEFGNLIERIDGYGTEPDGDMFLLPRGKFLPHLPRVPERLDTEILGDGFSEKYEVQYPSSTTMMVYFDSVRAVQFEGPLGMRCAVRFQRQTKDKAGSVQFQEEITVDAESGIILYNEVTNQSELESTLRLIAIE